MNLEQWVQNNPDELKPEKPNPSAIKELVSVAEREITDAKSVSSSEGKLTHAYAACLSIARSALAVCGFRIRSGSRSHHYKSIASLEYTIGLAPEDVREIQNYRQARHQSIYDFASVVSENKANCALDTAEKLLNRYRKWIKAYYPGLLWHLLSFKQYANSFHPPSTLLCWRILPVCCGCWNMHQIGSKTAPRYQSNPAFLTGFLFS